jgi:hypothetical protein
MAIVPLVLGSRAVHVLVAALKGLTHTPYLGINGGFVPLALVHSSGVLLLAGFLKLSGLAPTFTTAGLMVA